MKGKGRNLTHLGEVYVVANSKGKLSHHLTKTQIIFKGIQITLMGIQITLKGMQTTLKGTMRVIKITGAVQNITNATILGAVFVNNLLLPTLLLIVGITQTVQNFDQG